MALDFVLAMKQDYDRTYQELAKACRTVVDVVTKNQGLLQCPKVWAYVSGANGGSGWMDTCQNGLILTLLSNENLFTFTQAPPPQGEKFYYHDSTFQSVNDKSLWSFQRNEWRMGVESLTLLLITPQKTEPAKTAIISPEIAATAGFQPQGQPMTYAEWVSDLTS